MPSSNLLEHGRLRPDESMTPFLFALVSRDRVFGGDAAALVLVRFPSRGTGEAMKMQIYDVGRHGVAGAVGAGAGVAGGAMPGTAAGGRANRDSLRLRLDEHDGQDLRDRPFLDRKAALALLLRDTKAGILLNEHVATDGATVFAHACRLGAEGIVSKRVDGIYRSGPCSVWIKVRNPASIAVQRERSEKWNR
jgi:hypothetical protein